MDKLLCRANAVQDTAIEQEDALKGFFIRAINDGYARFSKILSVTDGTVDEFKGRLEFCCGKRIIPYLGQKEEDIIIKIDILRDLRSGIEYVSTLAELGRFLHHEVIPTKVQGKTHRVIRIPMQKLLDFLFPSF